MRHTGQVSLAQPSSGTLTAETPLYRVSAVSVPWAASDDVLLSDLTGRPYLFSHGDGTPTPLEASEANALGMFFEPTVDVTWHTIHELRRIVFGDHAGM